jgi:tRNA threonylcarbamoyladenosine modification (KEOPS) complex  Pcc1 subunit
MRRNAMFTNDLVSQNSAQNSYYLWIEITIKILSLFLNCPIIIDMK